MIKHSLKITVRKPNEEPINIAEFKKIPIAERMLSRWFGKVQKVTVIVPDDSVEKIEIKEMKIIERKKCSKDSAD